jgi:hypothetical protein
MEERGAIIFDSQFLSLEFFKFNVDVSLLDKSFVSPISFIGTNYRLLVKTNYLFFDNLYQRNTNF